MNELLAIFGPTDSDSELLTDIERLHPTRVTVLLETGQGSAASDATRPGTGGADRDWALDESPAAAALRDRLAALITLIERRTGATVTALAGDREQLAGQRFDREVSARIPIAA
jgi:hypothetical protein